MKKIITFIIFCAALNNLFAQADSSKTGTKVIFFGSNRTQEVKVYNGNAVKFGIVDIASGLYGLHYEKELSSIFSIQAGAGLTNRNFIEGAFYEALDSPPTKQTSSTFTSAGSLPASAIANNYSTTDLGDDLWNFTYRSPQLGYFIEIQPKFFITEDGFEGSYFGLNFQYRHYAFSAQNVDNTPTVSSYSSDGSDYGSLKYVTTNPLQESQNETIFALSFGHQWTGDKTIIEESISAGLRNISGQRRDIYSVTWQDFLGNYYTAPYAQLSNYTASQFYFEFTLKIGLWWANKK